MPTRETVSEQTQITQIEPLHVFKRILVPLDGSMCAEEALPVAAHIARTSDATVVLVRIVPPSYRHDMSPGNRAVLPREVNQQNRQKADNYLKQVVSNELLDGIGLHTELLLDNSVDVLVDYAKEQQVDLIVVCSHGHTGMKRWINGSVAQQMLRQNPIPLLIVQQGTSSLFQEIEAQHRPFNILVTLNGSILADTVLLPAAWISATLSAPLRGKLHLLRIVQPTYQINARAGNMVRRMNDEAIYQATIYLKRMEHLISQSELKQFHLDITSAVAFEADVAHTLMRVAEYGETFNNAKVGNGYDTIALATHGRQGLPRWIVGSVAEQLLGNTHVPLLVISYPHTSEMQIVEKHSH